MIVTFVSFKNYDGEIKPERISRIGGLMRAAKGADLYMLPELWNVGFFSDENYAECTEDGNGETVRAMSEAARELNAYVFGGSVVYRRGERLYNTALLFDRNGGLCGEYSKIHLFGSEKNKLTAGNEITVRDTEFGKIGISVCYDLRFPEQYRKMTGMGAEVFLNCAAWPAARGEHWELLNRARAVENQAVCLSVCGAGENNGTQLAGHSYAVSPEGGVLLKTRSEVETVDVDLDEVRRYRREFPVLKDAVKI